MSYIDARRMRGLARGLTIALVVSLLAACEWSNLGDDDEIDEEADRTPPVAETDVAGLSIAPSSASFANTDAELAASLPGNIGNRIVVDHQANAQSADLSLRPTTVYLFGLANRSTPLIAADPRAALDLPPRMLVYRDGERDIAVAYTNASYLDARYDLDDAEDGALAGLDDDLASIASSVTGNDPGRTSAAGIGAAEGIEERDSNNDFATTVNAVSNAIQARNALTLIGTVDFQAQAQATGRTLNPSTLFVFGNPNAGTPLMQASQTAGIDLPQKMLVTADDSGGVSIYYNDPQFIADRHDIPGQSQRLNTIASLLADIAAEAAGTGAASAPPAIVDNPAGGDSENVTP